LVARDNKVELCHLLSETKAQLQFLTDVDLSGNQIAKVRPILAKKLQRLMMNNNVVGEADFGSKGHDVLKVVSLNKNKLTSLKGITNLTAL